MGEGDMWITCMKLRGDADASSDRPSPGDPERVRDALTYLSRRLGLPGPVASADELISHLPPLSPGDEDWLLGPEQLETVLNADRSPSQN